MMCKHANEWAVTNHQRDAVAAAVFSASDEKHLSFLHLQRPSMVFSFFLFLLVITIVTTALNLRDAILFPEPHLKYLHHHLRRSDFSHCWYCANVERSTCSLQPEEKQGLRFASFKLVFTIRDVIEPELNCSRAAANCWQLLLSQVTCFFYKDMWDTVSYTKIKQRGLIRRLTSR